MKSYFTIEELCHSDTAIAKKIDNTPSEFAVENLKELIAFLNPLREAWGSPIIVNSGYRCLELNKLVGGVSTSAHTTGNAVDMVPKNGDFDKFKEFCLNYVQDKNFDQLIIENSGSTSWIHLGIYNNDGKQRHQTFKLTK